MSTDSAPAAMVTIPLADLVQLHAAASVVVEIFCADEDDDDNEDITEFGNSDSFLDLLDEFDLTACRDNDAADAASSGVDTVVGLSPGFKAAFERAGELLEPVMGAAQAGSAQPAA